MFLADNAQYMAEQMPVKSGSVAWEVNSGPVWKHLETNLQKLLGEIYCLVFWSRGVQYKLAVLLLEEMELQTNLPHFRQSNEHLLKVN